MVAFLRGKRGRVLFDVLENACAPVRVLMDIFTLTFMVFYAVPIRRCTRTLITSGLNSGAPHLSNELALGPVTRVS